ncbi:zinc finger protein-like [Tropilaelaps mercedesae]|uniref:Zinc finger protein-like n=1 Tax=Tropilaelaps mercedesae TaxID=418985 RepID=A0A1V9XV89_9ACAR|nr:zinc finger protein-like [Tropilaelaps mercedesae]
MAKELRRAGERGVELKHNKPQDTCYALPDMSSLDALVEVLETLMPEEVERQFEEEARSDGGQLTADALSDLARDAHLDSCFGQYYAQPKESRLDLLIDALKQQMPPTVKRLIQQEQDRLDEELMECHEELPDSSRSSSLSSIDDDEIDSELGWSPHEDEFPVLENSSDAQDPSIEEKSVEETDGSHRGTPDVHELDVEEEAIYGPHGDIPYVQCIGNLKRHLAQHANLALSCPRCGVIFAFGHLLQVHLRSCRNQVKSHAKQSARVTNCKSGNGNSRASISTAVKVATTQTDADHPQADGVLRPNGREDRSVAEVTTAWPSEKPGKQVKLWTMYPCPHCDKVLTWQYDLRQHMESHRRLRYYRGGKRSDATSHTSASCSGEKIAVIGPCASSDAVDTRNRTRAFSH